MTRKPSKQRTQTRRAPLHEKQKQVRAPLDDDLREEYDQRSVRVNEGDTVEITRGDFAGEEAEVIDVDLKDAVVNVEDVTREKADGEDAFVPLDSSNLRVTDLDLSDERREARLESEEDSA